MRRQWFGDRLLPVGQQRPILAATKIPVGEFAVRQYGEISLAATVTPTVRPPRLNQWTPASRQDAEIAGIP